MPDEVRRQETVRGPSSRLPISLCVSSPVGGNYIALILVPDEVCRQETVRAGVSPSSGIWVPVCVCFGSDADVSPVIGIQAPCLPVWVRVLFGVREPNYSSSDSRSRRDMTWIPSSTTDVRGANTFPLRNRLPYPFPLVARPCFFQVSLSVSFPYFGINNAQWRLCLCFCLSPPVVFSRMRHKRVLVDHGSSVDVLFWDAFQNLQLDPNNIQMFSGSLTGILGEQVQVIDHITPEMTCDESAYANAIDVG
ncbi:hypothetical protein KIW84_072115 [Lathyrus oleraceus]|uniref:Uncharacterized protein n=1 Tax=Pisum sativum TaxID=3888 RepID=A0A9D4VK79_PEA|nr:hypothetical protein KIW84_072115 [Pisum sativum]